MARKVKRPGSGLVGYKFNTAVSERHKAKIRTSMIINRVQNHCLGLLKKPMDDSQIRAADILLKKVLSDAPKILATDPKNPIIPKEVAIVGVRGIIKKES